MRASASEFLENIWRNVSCVVEYTNGIGLSCMNDSTNTCSNGWRFKGVKDLIMHIVLKKIFKKWPYKKNVQGDGQSLDRYFLEIVDIIFSTTAQANGGSTN